MSAVFHESDEAVERALFERRARALRVPEGIPSLETVLGEVGGEARESSSGRGRAWTGLALAAACLLAVMKTRPHESSPSVIMADVEPAAGSGGEQGGGMCEEPEVSACTVDWSYVKVPVAPVAHAAEERSCVVPTATFASSRTLSCDGDEGDRSEMR